MLLRGVYTFEPRPEDHDHTLSFTCNDNLVFLEVLKHDTNWIKVVDILGRIGYVPKNFTEPEDNFYNHELILTFLVDAVVKARQNDLPSASVLEALRDEVRDYPSIVEKRSREMLKIFRHEEKSGNKARRSASDQTMSKHSVREYVSTKPILRRIGSDLDMRKQQLVRPSAIKARQAAEARQNGDNGNNGSDSSERTANDGNEIKPVTGSSSYCLQEIKSKLVNVVQESSGLNTKLSENLLVEVFHHIKESTSSLPVESILDKLAAMPSKSDRTTSELEKAMKNLSKLSKDGIRGRQPSGACRRVNDSDFPEKLDKTRKLLIECDPFRVRQLLQANQHAFLQDLVHLYHLESPVNVKEKVLDIFLIICTVDRKGRNVLLSTTLPLYMARELMAGAGTKGKRIFKQQMDMLIGLLTCGGTMPETHFEIMGTGFVNFLLKEIEDEYEKSCEWGYDKISADYSAMINLILAFNLQFEAAKENIVLKVIAETRKRPKGFLSIIIELFRKASDPLRSEMEDDDLCKSTPNSVFKMVDEICLCQRTKAQLTPNDNQDLMDSIRDGLVGNPAGSVRLGYIKVLQSLLDSFQSNLRDVRTALLSILLDTDPLAIPEQQLIRAISKEVPTLFMRSISRIRTDIHGDDYNGSDLDHQEECFYLSS